MILQDGGYLARILEKGGYLARILQDSCTITIPKILSKNKKNKQKLGLWSKQIDSRTRTQNVFELIREKGYFFKIFSLNR